MGKYGNSFYVQLERSIFDEKYQSLTAHAKWLYTVLTELEHRFTSVSGDDFFFRTNELLAKDCGMSERQIIRDKKILADVGLIKTWKMHWVNKEGRKSEKHVSAFRIPRRTD